MSISGHPREKQQGFLDLACPAPLALHLLAKLATAAHLPTERIRRGPTWQQHARAGREGIKNGHL